jgi:beta-lactamase class A
MVDLDDRNPRDRNLGDRNPRPRTVRRRTLAALAGATLASPGLVARAQSNDGGPAVRRAIDRFARLPGASCLVLADLTAVWQAGHEPKARRFVGSALKTFILARYLRDVEDGRLTLDKQLAVDNGLRTLNSPVFLNLTGTTQAVSVLEAMITHSDNTATDIAMAAVGADRVRALIAEAGLQNTQIADSMRKMFSYLAGLDAGQDAGWPGVQALVDHPPKPRDALNDRMTMASTAEDMVNWYRRALRPGYFNKPGTLVEFKRIQAMATALSAVVPADTVAYGKGGSIDWINFHCYCLPGAMIVGKARVTFCFTINWSGSDDGVAAIFKEYVSAVANVLQESARAVG